MALHSMNPLPDVPTPIWMGRWREGEKEKGISNWFSIMKKMQMIDCYSIFG